MKIIEKRKYSFLFSALLIIISIFFLSAWGLKLGIDFTGGVLTEIQFKQEVSKDEVVDSVKDLGLSSLLVQPAENHSFIVRYQSENGKINSDLEKTLEEKYPEAETLRTEFVSSLVSSELKRNAIYAIIASIIGVTWYIAWAFRKISYPINSWKYGLGAVLALVHDIIITLGVFAILGHLYGVEVGIPFVAALLTIFGYSVNDTIVIFDRIRENLLRFGAGKDFEGTINKSIRESIARSLNTSLTVIFVLLAIIFFGGATIKYFALALLIGIFFGTYSSIFVATAFVAELWKKDQK
ncbi:MAG: protein translocase subunit SecF [Candidatus Moranbacteria bacterium]|nr:protein translocase subunit SecF [Candidatus Moranbacteria bacterium]